jgi:hypothetical protein
VKRCVCKRAGLENVRVHDLRRTVGSWLAQDGRSLHLIGDVLNHRDPKSTAVYAYFQTQQRREALTCHGDKVLALGAPHLRDARAPKRVHAGSLLSPESAAPRSIRCGSCEALSPRGNPIPGRGYWQRTEAGQPLDPTPLGMAPKGLAELLRIRVTEPGTSSQIAPNRN